MLCSAKEESYFAQHGEDVTEKGSGAGDKQAIDCPSVNSEVFSCVVVCYIKKLKTSFSIGAILPKNDERVSYWLDGNHLCKSEPFYQ